MAAVPFFHVCWYNLHCLFISLAPCRAQSCRISLIYFMEGILVSLAIVFAHVKQLYGCLGCLFFLVVVMSSCVISISQVIG